MGTNSVNPVNGPAGPIFERRVSVAVRLPVFGYFTYGVLPDLAREVAVGKRVLVPFGAGSAVGYVMDDHLKSSRADIRPLTDVVDKSPLFPPSMAPFLTWIADYYMAPPGQVVDGALPGGLAASLSGEIRLTPAGKKALDRAFLTPAEQRLADDLKNGHVMEDKLEKRLGASAAQGLIKGFSDKGWIFIRKTVKSRPVLPKMERFVRLVGTDLPCDRFFERRKAVLDLLSSQKDLPVSRIKKKIPGCANLLGWLEKNGYVDITRKPVLENLLGDPVAPDFPPVLTAEQDRAVEQVTRALGNGFSTFLLSGVTGSGKTEVYLRLAQKVMETGGNVLVLVPEIALISQMETRFRARFGKRAAILHSGLSKGERVHQWLRVKDGKVKIVVGARSAIFAPLDNPALIIVDEEHDPSYKQENQVRYNARDMAVVRARLAGGVALLGSATPSVQTYHNAVSGRFVELVLSRRVKQRPLPEVRLVDLRTLGHEKGARRYLSPQLRAALEKTLANKEQALLFLNRRGFAGSAACALCGQTAKCRHCDITLTYHKAANALVCHYCGFSMAAVSPCPTCGASSFMMLGLGSEKLEQMVKTLFPRAAVDRLDADTTRKKGSVVKILKKLKNRETDILVGTQMLAKGHDFPHITLVGVVCADLSLSFPDFRAGERAFQLLAQVAGRAGRGDVPGKVILQTFVPDHFSIQAAKAQDFRAFYNMEIPIRQALGYPPFSRMIQLGFSALEFESAQKAAMDFKRAFGHPPGSEKIEILGPAPAPVTRLQDRHRFQVLVRGPNFHAMKKQVTDALVNAGLRPAPKGIFIKVDVDPFSMI